MNELSKNIVKQAEIFACKTVPEQWLGPEEPNPKWWQARDSKIIELVIKECLESSLIGEWESQKIHKMFELNYKPKMQPNPDYGDLFTVKEWDESVKFGAFIPDDGDGYWATEKEHAYISVWDEKPDWATHVVWFNK